MKLPNLLVLSSSFLACGADGGGATYMKAGYMRLPKFARSVLVLGVWLLACEAEGRRWH